MTKIEKAHHVITFARIKDRDIFRPFRSMEHTMDKALKNVQTYNYEEVVNFGYFTTGSPEGFMNLIRDELKDFNIRGDWFKISPLEIGALIRRFKNSFVMLSFIRPEIYENLQIYRKVLTPLTRRVLRESSEGKFILDLNTDLNRRTGFIDRFMDMLLYAALGEKELIPGVSARSDILNSHIENILELKLDLLYEEVIQIMKMNRFVSNSEEYVFPDDIRKKQRTDFMRLVEYIFDSDLFYSPDEIKDEEELLKYFIGTNLYEFEKTANQFFESFTEFANNYKDNEYEKYKYFQKIAKGIV